MSKSNPTVMYIDDERDMLEMVKMILGRHKFQVEVALSGEEGLARLAEMQPDLILLDLMMPQMNGWEVYQKIKAMPHLLEVPVIILTAKAQSIDKVLGLHIARVDDYITKPFGPRELLQGIARVLSRVYNIRLPAELE